MARWFLLVTLAGCRSIFGFEDPVPLAPPDAVIDTVDPPVCATWTYAPRSFDPCAISEGIEDLVLSGTHVIDTNDGSVTGLSTPLTLEFEVVDGAMVVSVSSLTIPVGGSVRAVGDRPLAFVAWGGITIDGELDVASRVGSANRGAGADGAFCAAILAEDGASASNNGGGGGGAGLGGAAGAGGTGGGGLATGGGAGATMLPPTNLAAGCPGGAGALGNGGDEPAIGGSGGGGIALVARDQLSIGGVVQAGGAGGRGGSSTRAGGGGGGSGGMIVLEGATVITKAKAIVVANGGQGGGGCDGGDADVGADGRADALEAAVGNSQGMGSDGGGGGHLARPTGNPATNANAGGGGGGGGVGFVLVGAHPTATIDPATVFSPVAIDI